MFNIKIENMKKKIIIHHKNKKIKIIAEDCNLLKKGIGLMFSRRKNAKILLFRFKRKQKIQIHSLFVFYPFIALWINNDGKIIDMKKVNPFTFCISPKKSSFNLVEIPINDNNKKIIRFLVGN